MLTSSQLKTTDTIRQCDDWRPMS